MTKHPVDVDEQARSDARAELGTSTIKDTVNEALRLASTGRKDRGRVGQPHGCGG